MAGDARVVATIAPAEDPQKAAVAGLVDVWAELVTVKARLADAMNEVRAVNRENAELRAYVHRAVKRIDGMASKMQKLYQQLGAIR